MSEIEQAWLDGYLTGVREAEALERCRPICRVGEDEEALHWEPGCVRLAGHEGIHLSQTGSKLI